MDNVIILAPFEGIDSDDTSVNRVLHDNLYSDPAPPLVKRTHTLNVN